MLAQGSRVLLEGPMGAGKTTFARALLRALGVRQPPEGSPTFAIAHEYDSPRGGVVHYDSAGMPYIDEDPVEIHSGPTPELHVVRRGDTLWDICWYYFNDPWQWPKVWSYNGQITNPHWIYPGDLVRLMPAGAVTEPVGETPTEPGPNPNTGRVARVGGGAPQRAGTVSLRQVAFVNDEEMQYAGTIIGSPEEKEMLWTGDEVYIDYPEGKPPQVGQRYAVYADPKPIKHPETKAKVVQILKDYNEAMVKAGRPYRYN